MALKLTYYGQNDGTTVPDEVLTGDPGTDQQTLTAAGYLGGKIMALKVPTKATGLVAIVPCDAATMIPFGVLLNGPGEFAGAIGPSGSKKAPVVRAFFQGNVNFEAYKEGDVFTVGTYVYCGSGADAGLFVAAQDADGVGKAPVAICTHKPTTAEPWLGVASLL